MSSSRRWRRCVGFAALSAVLPCLSAARAQEAAVSPGARLAAATLRVDEGFRVTAVASEPLLANPVAFCFDPAGRIFVAETHRIKQGTEDNRDHMDWLDDDLAARTVEDRRAYIIRRAGDQLSHFTTQSELVRLLEDADGDGVYDRSSVFAEDFRDIVDGAAAGVMWNGDRLLFTCIPALWELRDADGDGQAEEKRALATGFGVRCALFGHDLHGLCLGPDGRIYFSIGDRGLHVETPDGVLSNVESGAVLRCRADGSELELFATGLRNPQELAFNEWGDLFTVDNNSDWGDRARVVHIVEGMRAGWRMSYQYLPDRGPFTRERIWETQNDEQPASIIPPLAHLTDGPSGLVYYPGTGMPADRAGAFFVCDFLGASGRSGVREFHLEQADASYHLTRESMFVQGVLATDCDFGPDGNLYVVDWLEGWTGTGMGRIYRVESDDPQSAAERVAVIELLARVEQAEPDVVIEFLGHADMRVRLAAQRRLIAIGEASTPALQALAGDSGAVLLARVHAIWALAAFAQKEADLYDTLAPLVDDPESEIRTQAARALGDARHLADEQRAAYGDALIAHLAEPSPRVKCAAAIALGKLKRPAALAGLLQLARDNDDRDPVIRHAAAMGLAGTQSADQLLEAARDGGPAERLAVVVALGRQNSPRVAEFLADDAPRVALEAARVIWDTPLPEAYGALAALVDKPSATSEPLLRRALAASLADGAQPRLEAVIRCGLRADVSPVIRELAWDAVRQWAEPSPREPVHGSWRPVAGRPAEQTLAALRALWPEITSPDAVDSSGVIVAAELGMPEAFAALPAIISDADASEATRARAVDALSSAEDALVLQAIESAIDSEEVAVRLAARRLLVKRFPTRAFVALRDAAESATPRERQEAVQMLAQLDAPEAAAAIVAWMDRVEQDQCPPELVLEVLEAATTSADEALASRSREFQERRAAEGPLALYTMCIEGGDSIRGQQVFATNTALSCRRCHAMKPDVTMIGPSLWDVGKRLSREDILESIVRPNAKITEGFQTTAFMLDTGLAVAGILRREDDTHAVLVDPDGKEIVVELATVEERMQGLSAMPEDLMQHMTLRDLRDLVAYMASLQPPAAPGAVPPATSEPAGRGAADDPEAAGE
jgi:quinoprotein glucose dehydrogenase